MKPWRYLLTAVMLLFCFSTFVFAHPGDTDSEGGHMNHNSGVYHYHHGYDAHSHADLNGDGTLDCPYEFAEFEDISNNGNTESKNTSSYDFYTPLQILLVTLIGIAGILVPFVLLYFVYNPPSSESPSTHNSPTTPPPKISTNEVQNAPNASNNLIPERFICRLMWAEVEKFRQQFPEKMGYRAEVYCWTALFYIVIKTIRKQRIVNLIYSHFPSTTILHFSNSPYSCEAYENALSEYRSFREELNASGIDPRTPLGINSLWELLAKKMFPKDNSFESAKTFFISSANRVELYTKTLFPTSSPDAQYSISSTEEHYDLPE